jgi:HPt (histidine-containing phosphotransfer) domain-containing protein
MDSLDESKLLELRGIVSEGQSSDLLTELIDIYLGTFPEMVEQIQISYKKQDWEELVLHTHKLRGMALNLGATLLADSCNVVEKKAKKQDPTQLDLLLLAIKTEADLVAHLLLTHWRKGN